MRIVILEDNLDRQTEMAACLADRFPQFDVELFVNSHELVEFLGETDLRSIALISLDNDLELIPAANGSLIDPGDGVEVASWLSRRPPACPVIVHTTNTLAGDRMMELLDASDWQAARVVPYDDTAWVHEIWRRAVRDAIVEAASYPTTRQATLALPLDEAMADFRSGLLS
jgi:hypothetical protein